MGVHTKVNEPLLLSSWEAAMPLQIALKQSGQWPERAINRRERARASEGPLPSQTDSPEEIAFERGLRGCVCGVGQVGVQVK